MVYLHNSSGIKLPLTDKPLFTSYTNLIPHRDSRRDSLFILHITDKIIVVCIEHTMVLWATDAHEYKQGKVCLAVYARQTHDNVSSP